jgi:hypothetical protein
MFSLFFSRIFKINQMTSWMSGYAIYQTFQIPEFSNALLASIAIFSNVSVNLFTIAYQLSFFFSVVSTV